ncbi:tetratricopeptide repeat protein [Rhodococcus sp. BS-15]|uniref:tetratricopeptide repeat protein n=1 Tax=Rhodococcus sp. BS-15 TaxID=1304954 RepID=UPI001650D7E3|nr:tetratricopeptide repeat protein [Rhodococcus sp. BS-15]
MAEFWRDADDTDPVRMRIQIDQLLSSAQCSDARGLFERASLEDFLGEESAAVPLYEASLSHGLDVDRENQARIQLASSLRNVGRQDDALRVLEEFEFSTDYLSARDAFVALALWDKGGRCAGIAERTARGRSGAGEIPSSNRGLRGGVVQRQTTVRSERNNRVVDGVLGRSSCTLVSTTEEKP